MKRVSTDPDPKLLRERQDLIAMNYTALATPNAEDELETITFCVLHSWKWKIIYAVIGPVMLFLITSGAYLHHIMRHDLIRHN